MLERGGGGNTKVHAMNKEEIGKVLLEEDDR